MISSKESKSDANLNQRASIVMRLLYNYETDIYKQ